MNGSVAPTPRTAVATLALWLLLVLPQACASRPQPERAPKVPPLLLEVQHFSGSPLAGATADEPPVEPSTEDAILVRCQILYLDQIPTALDPIGARVGLVIGVRQSKPILPTAAFLTGARVGSGAAAESFASTLFGDESDRTVVPIETLKGIVPVGVSTVFSAKVDRSRPGTSGYGSEISLLLSRDTDAADEVKATLVIEDSGSDLELRSEEQRQLLSLRDAPIVDGPPLVVIVPTPFASRSQRGFAAVVRARRVPADDPELADLVTACEENLAASRGAVSFDRDPESAVAPDRLLRRQALERFRDEGWEARADLLFALGGLDTPLARDLALSGDDALLDLYAKRVATLEEPLDTEWPLERSAFELLAESGARGESKPELEAILLHHAGQLGRRPGVLRRVVSTSADRIALERVLIDENQRLLADDDPATRLRAFDWLRMKGVVIPDYAPLDPPEDRRAALRAAEEQEVSR